MCLDALPCEWMRKHRTSAAGAHRKVGEPSVKEEQAKRSSTFKGAYVEESIYSADQLEILETLKSKEELIGEIITLLQSPAKNVISGLKSGGATLAGLMKTLEERAQ